MDDGLEKSQQRDRVKAQQQRQCSASPNSIFHQRVLSTLLAFNQGSYCSRASTKPPTIACPSPEVIECKLIMQNTSFNLKYKKWLFLGTIMSPNATPSPQGEKSRLRRGKGKPVFSISTEMQLDVLAETLLYKRKSPR